MTYDADVIKREILNYYGSNSTIWQQIELGNASAQDISFAFSQIPQRTLAIDRSADGLNLGFGYADPIYLDKYKNPILESYDSNFTSGQYASDNTIHPRINANFGYDDVTGQYYVESGAKGTGSAAGSTLATIADRCSLAVTGINVGAKLGRFIDETIYNIDPEFWDNNYPNINPQKWTSIAGDENGKSFIRTLFGIKNDTMTAYVDEDIVAYTYQLFRDLGLLDSNTTLDGQPIEITEDFEPEYITGNAKEMIYTYTGKTLDLPPDQIGFLLTVAGETSVGYVPHNVAPLGLKTPIDIISKIEGTDGTYQTGETTLIDVPSSYPYANIFYQSARSNGSISLGSINKISNTLSDPGTYIIVGTPIPAPTSAIPNSTQYPPTNITGTNPDDVKRQLKQTYPDLFDDAITEDVIQPDGSIKKITYLPIPWEIEDTNPDEKTQSQTKPKTNPNVTSDVQTNPKVSDDAVPKIVSPVVPPPSQPTTDTGTGDTPDITPVTGSASSLWAVYNPTQQQVNDFGAWLWTSDLVEQIKKLFVDPMQAIIGIHKVFVTPDTGSSVNIKCGYITSTVSAKTVTNQYTTVDCGTVSLTEYFGNVYDYEPFTSIKCFLPFIGIVPLNVSYIMRSKINIKYHVDVITGACLAEIKITRDGHKNIIYTYSGSAIVSYPLSSGSYAGVISSVVQTAMGVALGSPTMIASGVLSAHADTSVNGSFSGCAGAMGGKIPYLIISRPQTRIAENVNMFAGLGANYTTTIEYCKGYFKVKDVHLHIEGAYNTEVNEINVLLREGVLMESKIDEAYLEPMTTDIEGIRITQNGLYKASGDIRGYNPINVNVIPALIEKTVTSNGIYNATDYSAEGFSIFTVNVSGSASVMGFELYGATFGGNTQTFKGIINNNYIVCCFHDNMPNTYTLNGVTKNFTAIANGSGSGKIKASTIAVTGNTDTGLNSILLDGSELISRHDDAGSYMSVVGAWVGYLYGGSIYENAVSDSLTNSITMNSAHTKLLIFIAGSKAGLGNVTTVSINGITYNVTNMGARYDSVYSVYAAIEIDNNTDTTITVTYPASCHNYMSIIGFD